MKENSKINFKLTKKKVLVLANVIYFLLLCITCAVTCTISVKAGDILKGYTVLLTVIGSLTSQITFTALSLVVYYIAVMSDALNRKYKEEVEDKK